MFSTSGTTSYGGGINALYLKNTGHSSLFVFCKFNILVNLIYIFQVYFIGTLAIIVCPCANEATLKKKRVKKSHEFT